MKHKQFQKGINQLAEEGAVQVFRTFRDRTEDIILGVVGKLQFEVFEYRLKAEYGADIVLQHLRFNIARWVKSDNPEDIRQLHSSSSPCVKDHNGDTVVLYENDFALRWATEKNPRVRFCKPHELSDD